MARTQAKDYAEKRHAILKQSAAVFAERGIDRASMAEIAKACGVSKALLYHYYDSKDALLFDVIETHLTTLDNALADADDPGRLPEQRLRAAIHTVLTVYRDADHLHMVQLTGIPMLPTEMEETVKEIERRIVRRLSGIIGAVNPGLAGKAGQLTPMTMSLIGILNWVYMWFREDGPLTREAYGDALADMILGGLKETAR